jgi:hypothetical protein
MADKPEPSGKKKFDDLIAAVDPERRDRIQAAGDEEVARLREAGAMGANDALDEIAAPETGIACDGSRTCGASEHIEGCYATETGADSAEPEARPSDHVTEIDIFRQRVFSGMDVLMLCDLLGIGVGATIAAAGRLNYLQTTQPGIYREPDFSISMTVDEINEALFRLEGLDK